jgi:hypothetical protein
MAGLPGRDSLTVLSEYAFARFNKSLDMFVYTDLEYNEHLQGTAVAVPLSLTDVTSRVFLACADLEWTRAETDALMHACKAFALRWPVVADRLPFMKPMEARARPPPVRRRRLTTVAMPLCLCFARAVVFVFATLSFLAHAR